MQISAPLEVTHAIHIDRHLNWSFDPSVDPRSVFRQVRRIGAGGFGIVWQIMYVPSMKVLAGKLINPSLVNGRTRRELEAEIDLMREVDSPHTVKYYGSVKYNGSLMILMEYCARGSLRDLLDSRERVLSEDQISIVIRDLLKGLQLLQTRHRIVHRDIKAANILITADCSIRIADFGVSRRFSSGNCQTVTIVGTPYWMAPEVISGCSYSFPADLWSVGITAVELAEGAPPYVELAPTKAMIEIAAKGFPGYRYPHLHSSDFCDFVAHCVAYDPNRRWTIAELLEHPFIKRADRLVRADVLTDMVSGRGGGDGPVGEVHGGGRRTSVDLPSGTEMDPGDGSSPISFGSDLQPSSDELIASSSSIRPWDKSSLGTPPGEKEATGSFHSFPGLPRQEGPGGDAKNLNSLMPAHRPKVEVHSLGESADVGRTSGPKAPFARMAVAAAEDGKATVYHRPVGTVQAPVVNRWPTATVRPFVIIIGLLLAFGFFGVGGFVGLGMAVVFAHLMFSHLKTVHDRRRGDDN
jgi:serine/threonine protein kinase